MKMRFAISGAIAVAATLLGATPIFAQSAEIPLPPAPAPAPGAETYGRRVEVFRQGDVVIYGWATRAQKLFYANVGLANTGSTKKIPVEFHVHVTCEDGAHVQLTYGSTAYSDFPTTAEEMQRYHGAAAQCHHTAAKTMSISDFRVLTQY